MKHIWKVMAVLAMAAMIVGNIVTKQAQWDLLSVFMLALILDRQERK